MKILLYAVAFLLLSIPAWGDIYKWVDENGVYNVSNTAPQNLSSDQTKIETQKEIEYDAEKDKKRHESWQKHIKTIEDNNRKSYSEQLKKQKTEKVLEEEKKTENKNVEADSKDSTEKRIKKRKKERGVRFYNKEADSKDSAEKGTKDKKKGGIRIYNKNDD
jgi:Domain of unknown function (DUF4124)